MYVINGVSGKTGAVVASTLLADGKPVRVVVRDAAKGEPWKAKGAEVAVASAHDRAAMAKAFAGATGLYTLLTPPAWDATGVAEERKTAIAALTGAIADAKPKHVVFLSSIGADQPSGTGPVATLYAVEQQLKATAIPSTFLRPSPFMENWAAMLKGAIDGGALYYGLKSDLAIPQIATEDIGKIAAKFLVEGPPAQSPRVVQLAGPRDYSLADVAATISKLSGKQVKAVTVPPEAMNGALRGMGAKDLADLYTEMVGAINDGRMKFLPGDIIRGTTTLEQKLKQLLA